MSVIGPRPGLWNQDILTAERDKYNANDVKPGLTGFIAYERTKEYFDITNHKKFRKCDTIILSINR